MPVVEIHRHARERAPERGISDQEIIETIVAGDSSPAKFRRTSFRKTFLHGGMWRGQRYANKEIEAIAVEIPGGWLVPTVIARYF